MLKVRDLTVRFPHPRGDAVPLRDWNLDMASGEILAISGRSGCGKTVFCSTLLGILDPPGQITKGSIQFSVPETGTVDLTALNEGEWRRIRGSRISMIFQDPAGAFSPAHTVGSQFLSALRAHDKVTPKKALSRRAEDLLAAVLFPNPRLIMESYPFELSGGMGQRVSIAMALAHEPALLIADEPTTALDVISESQIISLFSRIRGELGTAILLVSHDEKILRGIADRLVKMPLSNTTPSRAP
ncbi:MAG: ABC transporter ATP-binding protein [Treponema sp.]|jgi:ABC-type dipeptide/oligopeptide/nickel transport system ATPase component|nr:ABC transporter ATP-binding protein [Treponema sp.]